MAFAPYYVAESPPGYMQGQRAYEQNIYGHDRRLITIPNNQPEASPGAIDRFTPQGISRWPGPPAGLPRQFNYSLGALAGARQKGWDQQNTTARLSPAWPYANLRQYKSLRATAQKVNRGAGAVAVPSVFVPTSPTNFFGSWANY